MNTENHDEQTPAVTEAPTPGKPRVWLSTVAIIISVVALVAVGQLWQKSRHVNTTTVATANPDLTALQQQVNQLQTELQQRQTMHTTSAPAATGGVALAWVYVKAAHNALLFHLAPSTALAYLQAADQALNTVTNVDTNQASQAINQEISQLKLLPNINPQQMVYQLDGLIAAVNQLPMHMPSAFTAAPIQETAAETWWQKTLAQLKSFVVIRHTDAPVRPLLGKADTTLVKSYIITKLLIAQMAVVQRHTQLYQSSLQQARHLLQMNFSAMPKATAIIDQLQTMAQQQLQYPAVNFTPILQALSALHAAPMSNVLSNNSSTSLATTTANKPTEQTNAPAKNVTHQLVEA